MRRIKDRLFENWHTKLFSLVLATGLWAMIAQESTSEIFFEVPVEYQNVPPNTELVGDSDKTVEVRLRGPSSLIREVAAKDISTIIDLDQIPQDGEKIVPLNAQHVHTPFGVDVVRITPSRVRVTLEPTVAVQLRVLSTTTGRLPPGYDLESIVVKPEYVRAEGPASRVRPLLTVMTTPLDLSNKKASFIQTVDLDLQDPLVRFPETTPIRADVKIRKRP